MSSSNNSSSNLNPQRVKEDIHLLDVRSEDFERCKSLDQEYTVILRKMGDCKAFADPSETGFASRIREINTAHRELQDVYRKREIDSFSQFLKEEGGSNTNDENTS